MADPKPGTACDRKQRYYQRLPIVFENVGANLKQLPLNKNGTNWTSKGIITVTDLNTLNI